MVITIDFETFDPLLKSKGPSCRYKQGALLSAAVQVDDKDCYFYRIQHLKSVKKTANGPELRFSKPDKQALKELRDWFASASEKVFANASYELAWAEADPYKLWNEQIHRESIGDDWLNQGRMYDILIDGVLEQGAKYVSVDELSQKYGLATKPVETLLSAIIARMEKFGFEKEAKIVWKAKGKGRKGKDTKVETDFRAWLWTLSGKDDEEGWRLLQEYNEHDVKVEYSIFKHQQSKPQAEVHRLESLLIPVVGLMQNRGVRIDKRSLQELTKELLIDQEKMRAELERDFGCPVPINMNDEFRAILDDRYNLPRTEQSGAPKADKDTLAGLNEPLIEKYLDLRGISDLLNKFIAMVRRNRYGDVVYPRINQVGIEGGTVTGRFSYQGINLQNQPKPKEIDPTEMRVKDKYASRIRQLFIPYETDHALAAADYSAQEPRMITHWCVEYKAPKHQEDRQVVVDDPYLDYHQNLADAINEEASNEITAGTMPKIARKPVKFINLGIPYGQGASKIKKKMALPGDVADRVWACYEKARPGPMWLLKFCDVLAQRQGYLETVLGRRRNWDAWEVDWSATQKIFRWTRDELVSKKEEAGELKGSLEELREIYPTYRFKRYRTYTTALNLLAQGSAADQTKMAMVKLYYLTKILPYMQVHDEILVSYPKKDVHIPKKLAIIMVNALMLNVPFAVEYEVFKDAWHSEVVLKAKLHGKFK